MTGRRRPAALAAAALVGTALVVAGCGSDGSDTSAGGQQIAVEATDTTCVLSTTTVAPGAVTVTARNTGSQVTEVYVYRADDSVVAEKENIGPGTSGSLTATLEAGEYQIACKPGQTGDGIRTRLLVTPDATASPAATS